MLSTPSRALVVFWIGAAIGLAVAIGSLALPKRAAIPEGAVALVNGVPISRADYDIALRALAESARHPPTPSEKHAALSRLVDEELMLAQGEKLGMVRADGPTRHALLSAVFAAERAPGLAEQPAPDDLERFYQEISAQLQRPGAMHVRQISIRVADRADDGAARGRAQQAAERLRAGENVTRVRTALATPGERDPPDALLPFATLRDMLGPVVVQSVLRLAPGEVGVFGSHPLFRAIQLVEKRPAEIPALEVVHDAVLERYRQHAADAAFVRAVAEVRHAAEIRLPEIPP